MKKLIFLILVFSGISGFSQVVHPEDEVPLNTISSEAGRAPSQLYLILSQDQEASQGCVLMRNGSASLVRSGVATPATEMTLGNGAKLGPDGSLRLSDGSSYMLKEGQCVTMSGSIVVLDYSLVRTNTDVGK